MAQVGASPVLRVFKVETPDGPPAEMGFFIGPMYSRPQPPFLAELDHGGNDVGLDLAVAEPAVDVVDHVYATLVQLAIVVMRFDFALIPRGRTAAVAPPNAGCAGFGHVVDDLRQPGGLFRVEDPLEIAVVDPSGHFESLGGDRQFGQKQKQG